MVEAMEITAGFQKTEAGVIPNDWVVLPIEELTPKNKQYTIVDGPFGSNLKTIHYRKSGIPIITSGYVTDGKFFASEYLYVDLEKFKQERRSAVKGGDIVMAKIGERCGASAILPKEHPEGILSGNALKITIDENRYSTELIAQILWRYHTIRNFEILRTTGAQPAISMANLKKYKIPLPPTKAEQTAIATALNDADALIIQLEKLIAKKRNIKQGAMQKFLKPKDGWVVKKLGEIFKFLNTANNSRADLVEGGEIEYIHYGDIHTRWNCFLDCSNNELPFIDKIKVNDVSSLEDGDLVIADASEDYEGLGACVEIKNIGKRKIVAGLHTLLLRGDKNIIADGFKGYLRNYYGVKDTLIRLSTGVSVYGISKTNLKEVEVSIPPTVETQTRIAKILSDMDSEIEALEKKLDKYKMIKQGMMQNLLTGKIRLV